MISKDYFIKMTKEIYSDEVIQLSLLDWNCKSLEEVYNKKIHKEFYDECEKNQKVIWKEKPSDTIKKTAVKKGKVNR